MCDHRVQAVSLRQELLDRARRRRARGCDRPVFRGQSRLRCTIACSLRSITHSRSGGIDGHVRDEVRQVQQRTGCSHGNAGTPRGAALVTWNGVMPSQALLS